MNGGALTHISVALVSAFAADADLLVLDEPTSGLDPLMERVFTECVLHARQRGCTILLSSHILSEVEKLCQRVSIIRAGSTVQSGTLAELRIQTRTFIDATTRVPVAGLAQISGISDLESEGTRVRFAVDAAHLDDALACLGRHTITALTSTPPTLEDLFLEHYSSVPDPADDRALNSQGAVHS